MNQLTKRLAEIQQNLKAPKGQFNKFGGYSYRSCEDILEAVKPLLGDLVLTISDEIMHTGDRYYVLAHAELTDGENKVSAQAIAREAETKKGMDEAQITGSASSYARKYALNGLFAIDDTKDADTQDNHQEHVKAQVDFEKAAKQKPAVKKATETEKLVDELFFNDEKGEVARDSKGHTACVSCGKVVGKDVEAYSLGRYKKVLCRDCQKKASV